LDDAAADLEVSMTRTIIASVAALLGCLAGCATPAARSDDSAGRNCTVPPPSLAPITHYTGDQSMRLGNFSVSLAVKDLAASRAFYEKLGFRIFAGDESQNWLILQNDTATIGLFQGMFDKNLLTFNPGWDRAASTLPDFDDVREIQRQLKARGLPLASEIDESAAHSGGPASLMLVDPDGNPILIDQHVSSPAASPSPRP
jgi:catechol 2,3-dioxygenase-like lactoylglutathione lyase family enzyme